MRRRAALVARPRRTGPRPATSALVTWKLPLPTTPKTCVDAVRRPARARRASATVASRSALDQGQHPARAARAARRSAAARRSRPRRSAAARPGSAAGSGRTCRCRAGTSGTGTAGRTSGPAPASVPTVSTPTPWIGASSASHRAHSTEMPGRVRPRWRRNAAASSTGRPSRCGSSSQPPAGSGPCSASHARMWSTSSRKSGSSAACGRDVEHHGRRDQPARPAPATRRRRRGR